MLDVRLISLLPPAPAIGQPPAVQSATTNATNILSQIPTGSLLAGFIINRDASGNPILRTDKGDITFTSQFFLKIGSEVVIRVAQNGNQQNAHIVTVNGLPPEVAAGQSGFADEPNVIVGTKTPLGNSPENAPKTTASTTAQTAANTAPVITKGSTVSAVVVTPQFNSTVSTAAAPNNAAALFTPTKPLLAGTSLFVSVLGINIPPTPVSTTNPLAPTTSGAPLAQLIPQQSAHTITTNLASLLPATPENVAAPSISITTAALPNPTNSGTSYFSIQANQQAASANFAAPLGQVLTATLITQQEDGSATFASPVGVLRVPFAATLAPNSQLTLQVVSLAPPTQATIAIANSTATLPPAPITELAHSWTSLAQIVQMLGTLEPPLTIANLPTLSAPAQGAPLQPANLGNGLLFFISALKGGDFKNWVGERNVKALEEKGYGSLIRKAEGEFMSIARQFTEPPPNNWQSLFFPVAVQGEVQQVRAFIKREKKKDEQGKPTNDEDTRFVVEMNLSALGEMQMDGLVKRRDDKLQFDLVVRSLESLPENIEQDIKAIYSNTAELTGYRGQLVFQAVHHFPIHPMEDIAPHVDDVIV